MNNVTSSAFQRKALPRTRITIYNGEAAGVSDGGAARLCDSDLSNGAQCAAKALAVVRLREEPFDSSKAKRP